jgi:hypothetical protein
VRICTKGGATLIKGRFEPAAFADIWFRFPTGNAQSCFGAMYQSVLVDLEWADVSHSPFLMALKAAASNGRLSIKFNLDGFDDDATSPTFTQGRIVGTIGPVEADEPSHLILGRHLLPSPKNRLNSCMAVVDATAGLIYVDLGNALPTSSAGGPLLDLGSLTLSCVFPDDPRRSPLLLGTIPYLDAAWYSTTAGVVAIKVATADLPKVQSNPWALILNSSGDLSYGISEPFGGHYVRADQFVFRVEPGEHCDVKLFATAYGKPIDNAIIINTLDSSQLPAPPSIPSNPPVVATPRKALHFPNRIATNSDGIALLPINTTDPNNPRIYIDGQVYAIGSMLEGATPRPKSPLNPSEFISILLWNNYDFPDPPTWHSLREIFQRYANLYPVMETFLNLGDYESVCAHRELLLLAFSLDPQDPNSMPVSRDLSPKKRKAILHWLKYLGPDSKPLLGQPSIDAATDGPQATGAEEFSDGGKGAALAARLLKQRP